MDNFEKYYEYQETDKGAWYKTETAIYYIPNDVDANTDVVVWEKGSEGSLEDIYYGKIYENIKDGNVDNTNTIYAFPIHYDDIIENPGLNDTYEPGQMKVGAINDEIEQLMNSKGVDTYNITTAGYSAAGATTLNYQATTLKNNPSIADPTIVLMDPVKSGLTTDENIAILGERNATIIAYQSGDTEVPYELYEKLAKSGATVVVVKPKHQSHSTIRAFAVENGAFGLMSGTTNSSVLDQEDTEVVFFNNKTNNWETIKYDKNASRWMSTVTGEYVDLDSLQKKSFTFTKFKNMFKDLNFVVASDLNYLMGSLGVIKSAIQSTGALNGAQSLGISSTTTVPVDVEQLVYEYLSAVAASLEKLSSEIQSLLNIGIKMEEKDKELEKDAEETAADVPSSPNATPPVAPIYSPEENNPSPVTDIPVSDTVNADNQEFPPYEEIYSDNNKIVYNYNDEYKIIIRHDGEKITSIEHYYDLSTAKNAQIKFDELNNKYSSMEGFKEAIQNDRYIKISFKDEIFKDLTLSNIKSKYSNLEEVRR